MSQRTAFRIGDQVRVQELHLVLCCAPNLRRQNVHQRALVYGAFPEISENEANMAAYYAGAVLLISAGGALCNGGLLA